MPITPGLDALTGNPRPRKKRKKREEEADDIAQRIEAVESIGRGTIPTEFVYGVAASSGTSIEAARAGAALARELDIPQVSLLEDGKYPDTEPRPFLDPVSGGKLTLQTSRSFDEEVTTPIIAKYLDRLSAAGITRTAKPAKGRKLTESQIPQTFGAPKVLTVYVADKALRSSVEKAAAMWNTALGSNVVRITATPGEGAIPIESDQRGGDFADAEFTEGKIVGNRGALKDAVTMAHELGHALGLQHPATRKGKTEYLSMEDPWPVEASVPAKGLMGTEKGQRKLGPDSDEVQALLKQFGQVQQGSAVGVKVEPGAVLAYTRAMASLPGQVPLEVAIGAAVALIHDSIDIGRFTSALTRMSAYNGETGPFSDAELISAAHVWAKDSELPALPGRQEIADFLNPEVALARKVQEENVAKVRAQAWGQTAGPLGAGVPATEKGVLDFAAQQKEEESRLDALRKDANGLPSRYDSLAAEVLADRMVLEAAEANSFFTKSFKGLLDLVDGAWRIVSGGVSFIVSPAAKWVGALKGGDTFQEAGEAFSDEAAAAAAVMESGLAEFIPGPDPKVARAEDRWAENLGFEEGTRAHDTVSMGLAFLVGWYLDPFVLGGKLRQAVGIRRGLLVGDEAARVLKGTGPFKPLAITRDVEGRVGNFLAKRVRKEWAKAAGGEKMPFREWLTRMALDPRKHDLAAELPRGVFGIGEGINRRVLTYVQNWAKAEHGFDAARALIEPLPPRLLAEVDEIFAVMLGAKPASRAGEVFGRLINDGYDTRANELAAKAVAQKALPSDYNRLSKAARKLARQKAMRYSKQVVSEGGAGRLYTITGNTVSDYATLAREERVSRLRQALLDDEGVKAVATPAPPKGPPPIEALSRYGNKPNTRRDAGELADVLYRETSPSGAAMLVEGNTGAGLGGTGMRFDTANTENLALGQGQNRGVLLEMDAPGLEGWLNTSKPAWEMSYGAGEVEITLQYNTGTAYAKSIRKVTIRPGQKGPDITRMVYRLERKGWAESMAPDGSRVFTRPGLQTGEQVADAAREAATQRARDTAERMVDEPQAFEILGEAKPLSYADALEDLQGAQRNIPLIRGLTMGAREARLGVKSSAFYRGRMGGWLRSFFEMVPGGAINIEDITGDLVFSRWLNSWEKAGVKTFTPERISELRSRFTDIASIARPDRETLYAELLRSSLDEAYAALGLDDRLVKAIADEASSSYAIASAEVKQMFGFIKTGRGLEDAAALQPLFETQLLNTLVLPDPASVVRSVRDAFGTIPAVRTASLKRFGKELEDLTEEQVSALVSNPSVRRQVTTAWQHGSKRASDAFLAIWKPTVLLRPAWTMRVVLLDENVRAFTILQSSMERFLGIKGVAKVAKKMGAKEGVISLPGVETPRLGIPGLIPDEPAVSAARRSEVLASSVTQEAAAVRRGKIMRAMTPKDQKYLPELSRILNLQVGQSPLGRRIVSAMTGAEIEGKVWSRESIIEWITTDERASLLMKRRVTLSPEEVLANAEGSISLYTQNDPQILGALLEGSVSPGLLKTVWPERGMRPAQIHSQTLDRALLRSPATGLRATVDFLFDVLARRPIDYLSRQPVFKALYARERERLLGLGNPANAAESRKLIEVAEKRAKEYAVGEVRRVMYSLTERSRFADAHTLLTPFFAPYQESLHVWKQLVWQNPTAVAHANLIGRAAYDSGLVYKDDDGVLRMNFNVPFSPIFNAIFGLGGDRKPDFGISLRLEGLNLFLSGAYPLGTPLGELDVPLPGLGPLAQPAVQFFAEKLPEDFPGRARIQAWAFTYGPGLNLIPKPWERILAGTLGIGKPLIEREAQKALDLAALKGLTIGTEAQRKAGVKINGKPIEYTDADARSDSRAFLFWRGFTAWFSPAAPEFEWPQDEAREKFFDWRDRFGPARAAQMLRDAYPDSPGIGILAVSHTMYEGEGFPIPATAGADAVFAHPEIGAAIRAFPEFGLFFIPHELREGAIDDRLYQAQIGQGLRVARTLDERITEDQRRQGWEAYFALKEAYDGATAGLDPDDPKVILLRTEFEQGMVEIGTLLPEWEQDKANLTLYDPQIDNNLRVLRGVIAKSEIFRGTEVGKMAENYLKERDLIEADLKAFDIDSINSSTAEKLGLTKRYDKLVEESKKSEDFAFLYEKMLDGDLRRVKQTQRDIYQGTIIAEKGPRWVKTTLGPWTQEHQALIKAATDAGPRGVDQSRAFLALRTYEATATEFTVKYGVNPLEVSWRSQTEYERQRRTLAASLKPYVFLTPFEKETVLGLKVSPEAEAIWLEAAKERLRATVVARDAEKRGDDDAKKAAWESYDGWLRAQTKKSKAFATEFARSRKWGYTFFSHIPKEWTTGKTDAAVAWQYVESFIGQVYDGVEKTRINSYDDSYGQTKIIFEDWIADLYDDSELFKGQWTYLQSVSGGTLVDDLFPPTWFPLREGE